MSDDQWQEEIKRRRVELCEKIGGRVVRKVEKKRMPNGQIVERGKFHELLDQRGFFHELYMSQYRRQEPAGGNGQVSGNGQQPQAVKAVAATA